MNLLSRRSVLAIAAVVDVALHSRSAPVAAKALAARHKLPARHLETLLQGLVHAKILKGVRGPRGGYELARERRRITVGEDKAYDCAEHVANLRAMQVTPHVTQNNAETKTGKRRHSAVDGRTTRHAGYGMSQSRRAMIECIFGWGKQHGTMRKTKHHGRRRRRFSHQHYRLQSDPNSTIARRVGRSPSKAMKQTTKASKADP